MWGGRQLYDISWSYVEIVETRPKWCRKGRSDLKIFNVSSGLVWAKEYLVCEVSSCPLTLATCAWQDKDASFRGMYVFLLVVTQTDFKTFKTGTETHQGSWRRLLDSNVLPFDFKSSLKAFHGPCTLQRNDEGRKFSNFLNFPSEINGKQKSPVL